MSEPDCDTCEYRACREEDGNLGDCKGPELEKEIEHLNKWLLVAVTMPILVFIIALIIGQ